MTVAAQAIIPVICPGCAPHQGHGPKACEEGHCRCGLESRLGRSEFVVRARAGSYFAHSASMLGPAFGVTQGQAYRFATQIELRAEMARWPMIASVGCKIESVPKLVAGPFVKWAGGKRQLLGSLRGLTLGSYATYYEPFVGGGALYFDLRARQWGGRAILADRNERLMSTYFGVRDDVESVIQKLSRMHYDKEEYLATRKRSWEGLTSPQIAARFIYLNRCGYNGMYRVNAKNEFNIPFGRYKNPTICDALGLRASSAALQNTTFEFTDFEMTVAGAKKGDLVYFDPPYVPVSESSDFTGYTQDGFGWDDHVRLRDCALQLKKRGVHVVLSNADIPAVRELYQDFEIHSVQARRNINSKGDRRMAVGEVLMA